MARKPARPARRRPAPTRRRGKPAPPARARRRPTPAPRAAARAPREPRAAARPRADGTLSQAEYARRRGVSREAVRRALKDGRIRLDARGRIDPAAADAAWRANTDPGRPSSSLPEGAGPPAPATAPGAIAAAIAAAVADGSMELPDEITLNDARAVREWNQAVKLFVQRRQMTDELVEAKKVEDAAYRAARTVRDRLGAIPERLGATLAATSDVTEVKRMLLEELNHACAEFATKMFQDPEADDDAAPPRAAAS